jgi:hypothetical protein
MDAVSIVSQVSGADNLAGVVASYTEESALVTRIRALVESYSHSFGSYQEARKRFKQERAELIPLLAEYKEKLVGVGRDGQWRPFVDSLSLPVSFKTIDRGVNGYMEKMYNVQLPEPTVPPLPGPCEDAAPPDRRQLLEATYGQFETVFQPMLARDPEQFLQELRLHFQIIVNRLVGDGEGFTVLFTNVPEGLGKE